MGITVSGEPADSIFDVQSIKMHRIITQKIVILIFTAVRISDLTQVEAV
jgi:hypothetical protein